MPAPACESTPRPNDPERVDALEGPDFPASSAAIQQKAKDKGGIDAEVNYVLAHLPDRTYDSMEDLAHEVDLVYATVGPLEGDGPAAPSEASARDKTIIESRADTRAGEPPGQSKTGPQPDLRA
ncbi:MAG TPA: DUF2795 domain-containing protein [Dehalococcoidia bacterium]|nr:DUF2795 domain-containing protein [Dehalococcoidia bacterium]